MNTVICSKCGGYGEVYDTYERSEFDHEINLITCPECMGLGQVEEFRPRSKPVKRTSKFLDDLIDKTMIRMWGEDWRKDD